MPSNNLRVHIFDYLLHFLCNRSDKTICTLVPIVRSFSPSKLKKVLDAVNREGLLLHPLVEVGRRFYRNTNTHTRHLFYENMVVKSLFGRAGGASRFGRSKSDERRSFPPVLFLTILNKCNLKCPDCLAHTERGQDSLDFGSLNKLIDEGKRKGTKIFAISGGEPFMYHDLLTLFETHKDTYFHVFTNGTLLDDDYAERLSEIGNAILFISLEGFEEETDKRRGEGTFRKVIENMNILREHGVIFGASVMTTPPTFDAVTSEMFAEMLLDAGASVIWYLSYRPAGNSPDFSELMTKRQRNELFKKVVEIRNKLPIVALDNLGDANFVGGCLATLGLATHINPRSKVEICAALHFSTESIDDYDHFETLLRESKLLNRIREVHNPGCERCLILDSPAELKQIIDETGAEDTALGKEYETLKHYIAYHRALPEEEKNPPHERLDEHDIYRGLKELLLQ